MVNFFKGKDKEKEEVEVKDKNNKEGLKIDLSINPNKGDSISDLQKNLLQEEIDELPPIKEGDINVSGVYLYDNGDNYEVKIYIRNGFKNPVNFEYVPLMLINSKGEILANQNFNLKGLGDIPSMGARPYVLNFKKENVKVDKIDAEDWKVAFDKRLQAFRNIETSYEGMPEDIDVNMKAEFDKFLNELPRLKEGQVTISKFHIMKRENGSLLIILIVRNGAAKTIKLEKIPVTVKDNEKVVAAGMFTTELEVNPGKAKILTVEFDENLVAKGDINFNNLNIVYEFDRNGKLYTED